MRYVRYGGRKQLRRIFNFLYSDNGLRLDRKYTKFKEVIT